MAPPHEALPVHREAARRLPPAAAARRPVPDSLAPAQPHHAGHAQRVEHVPRRRRAQAPRGVRAARVVHEDGDGRLGVAGRAAPLRGAAERRQPFLRALLRGVRDGDEGRIGMSRCGEAQRAKGLFCDLGAPARCQLSRKPAWTKCRLIGTDMDSHSV